MPTPSTRQRACWPGETPFSPPPPPAFVPRAQSAPHCPRGRKREGLATEARPSRLHKPGRGGCPGAAASQGARVPLQSAGERSDLCQSLLGEVCLPAQGLGAFFPCQGDAPWLEPPVSPHGLAPAQPAHPQAATPGSACPGLLCGGEPDGQRCLPELPPSSRASASRSRLGRCPRPLPLLQGPGPVRLRAPAGRLPRHCPVPFSSWTAWT